MDTPKEVDFRKIEQVIISLSKLVKEIVVFREEGYLFALIYPDFEEAKNVKLMRIKSEIRWYAVELYNLEAKEGEKIDKYRIVQNPLPKNPKGEIERAGLEIFIEKQNNIYQNTDYVNIENGPSDEVYQSIKKFIETLTKEPVNPSSHLEFDLHLDSLNYVEIITFIEESFSVIMDESKFSQLLVMDTLCQYISKKKQKIDIADINWKKILNEKIDFNLVYTSIPAMLYKTFFFPLFKLYFLLKVSGHKNLPKQPYIIAPSHQSMLDGFIMAAALPYSVVSKTFYLVFQLTFDTKIMRHVMRYSQSINIDVNKNLKASIQKCAVPLRDGQNLVIFPEGARTRDRKLLKFKKFFAILSVELNIPIVPVVLDGTFESLPSGKMFPRPARVIVKYLEPIYPEGLSYEELTMKVKEAIQEEMSKHPLHST